MDFSLDRAIEFVSEQSADFSGRMLAPVGDLGVGSGLIYSGITFPFFSIIEKRFQARIGSVLVLTHECDVEQGNDKVFNSDVMFAPLAPFEHVYRELNAKRTAAETKAYLGDLVRCRISQLFYIPPWTELPNGAVALLNRIGHTHVSEFESEAVKPLATLTAFGYERLGYSLQTHFLRPKGDRLPFMPTSLLGSF